MSVFVKGRRKENHRKAHQRRRVWRCARFVLLASVCYAFLLIRKSVNSFQSSERRRNFASRRLVFPQLRQCDSNAVDDKALHAVLTRARIDAYVPRETEKRWIQLRAKTYFFAINLHNNEEIIPYLFGAVIKACVFLMANSKHLATQNFRGSCFISVYESGSTDATRSLLASIENDVLKKLHIPCKFIINALKRDLKQHRIEFLAEIRNRALAPLYGNSTAVWDEVVFLNDVVTCASNILELLAQKSHHAADVVSGMDYIVHKKLGVLFYDTWVNKDVDGRSFSNQKPFIKNQNSWERYQKALPFQVFTTWSGGVVITASLFYSSNVRFRHSGLLECASCECELLIRDLWHHTGTNGLKVMVVPAVYVAYSVADFVRVSHEVNKIFFDFQKGSSSINDGVAKSFLANDVDDDGVEEFVKSPPETIECCGMEFPGEQLLNFELQTTNMPWRWWYDAAVRREESARSAIDFVSTAISTFNHRCSAPSSVERHHDLKIAAPRSTSDAGTQTLHFILPTLDPTTMPHMAFAHMLEWARLNPCSRIQFHRLDSLVPLADEASASWGIAAQKVVDIQDVVLTLSQQNLRRRLMGYLILYLYGGIVADLEVLPLSPISSFLLSIDHDYEAAFGRQTLGDGPYVIAARARSETLGRVIELCLKRLAAPASIIAQASLEQMGCAFSERAPAHEILTRAASILVGRRLFEDVTGLTGASSETLERTVQIRGPGRKISSLTHESIITLYDGDLLTEGELFLSSAHEAHDELLWKSNTDFEATSSTEDRHIYLTLRSAARRNQSDEGCLEVIADARGKELTRATLWRQCWPRSKELGMVYLGFESGIIRVYTSTLTSCGAPTIRKILWSTPSIGRETEPRWCVFRCRSYLLHLNTNGELRSLAIKVGVWRTRTSSPKHRCLLDAFSAPECQNNALSVVRRQLIRYRDGCQTVY